MYIRQYEQLTGLDALFIMGKIFRGSGKRTEVKAIPYKVIVDYPAPSRPLIPYRWILKKWFTGQ